MTKDDVIRLARETGFFDNEIDDYESLLLCFAKLVAEHEREACAKVCEDREEQWRKAGFWGNHHEFREMAFAIRARGQA